MYHFTFQISWVEENDNQQLIEVIWQLFPVFITQHCDRDILKCKGKIKQQFLLSEPCMEIELTSSGITNDFLYNLTGTGAGILLGRYIRERLPINGKASYRHETNPVFLYYFPGYGRWGVRFYCYTWYSILAILNILSQS